MSDPSQALTTLSEAQRVLAMERFSLLRPVLEEGVSQAEVARLHHLPLRTVQRWIERYRKHGLSGLAKKERKDKGARRGMPPKLVQLIEGLALQKPKRSAAAIHRQVVEMATEYGWSIPSYSRIYDIIQKVWCCSH